MCVYITNYGNHQINFMDGNFNKTAIEIKKKLDNLKLLNDEYLKKLVISQCKSAISQHNEFTSDHNKEGYIKPLQEKINKFENTTNWDWNFNIKVEDDLNYIRFDGFLDFTINFFENCITFEDIPDRSNWWFGIDNKIIRDEWRKYMHQVIRLFGGNRLIYLSEEIPEEIIFITSNKKSFNELEKKIIEKYGENRNDLNNINEEDFYYYIDYFNDLN